jgi:hypothetical protein
MKPRELAAELEAERFDRFGIDQDVMRRVGNVILVVARRTGADLPTLLAALTLYPALDFHADREPFRQPGGGAAMPPCTRV